MGYNVLRTEEVVKIYKLIYKMRGRSSGGAVAEELDRRNIRTHTGKAPTRQAVIWQMQKTEEGRMLLDCTRLHWGKGVRWNDEADVRAYMRDELGLEVDDGSTG